MPEASTIGAASSKEVRVFRKKTDFLGGFREYVLDELGQSPRTADSYLYYLRTLAGFAGKPIERVTADDLRRFKREAMKGNGKPFAPATKQGVVVAMHQFHRWGALEEHWSLNGIAEVPTPRVIQDPNVPMSPQSAGRLLAECSTALDHRIVYLGLYAGLRIAEAASLDETNWVGRRLIFRGKGAKKRTVPVHPELNRKKALILSAQPKSTGVLQSNVKRLRERAQVSDLEGNTVTSHTLRRTFATTLYDKHHVPYEVVAKLLGHGGDVTARYVRVSYERMKEAVDALDYFSGEPTQMALF